MPSARQLAPVLGPALVTVLALAAAAPAAAGGVSLYGAWWETEEAGDALGAGIRVGFGIVPALDLDLRATYYEEVEPDFLDVIREGEDPRVAGFEVLPVDVGLRLGIGRRRAGLRPYLGAGGTYYKIEGDVGDVDDEVGYYALFGLELGDERGPRFFVEADYRTVEATVTEDVDDPIDLPDLDLEDGVDLDLGGVGVNLGLAWSW